MKILRQLTLLLVMVLVNCNFINIANASGWTKFRDAVTGGIAAGALVSDPLLVIAVNNQIDSPTLQKLIDEYVAFNELLLKDLGVGAQEIINSQVDQMMQIGPDYFHWGDLLGDVFLYEGYRYYMKEYLDKDSQVIQLDQGFIDEFNRLFQSSFTVQLSDVTFKQSPGTPDGTAVTDCKTIYFPADSTIIAELSTATRPSDFFTPTQPFSTADSIFWFLHEFTHAQQCDDLGGRIQYALYWFDNVAYSITVDPTNIQHDFATQFSDMLKSQHDSMIMEINADKSAESVILASQQTDTTTATQSLVVRLPNQKAGVMSVLVSQMLLL